VAIAATCQWADLLQLAAMARRCNSMVVGRLLPRSQTLTQPQRTPDRRRSVSAVISSVALED